jgi:hypothetical protein
VTILGNDFDASNPGKLSPTHANSPPAGGGSVTMSSDKATKSKYDQYIEETKEEIADCLQTMGCQPILFIGSGLSKRYFGGPNWDELLSHLAKSCPLIDKDYAYYKQSIGSPLLIGEEFARRYHEWAWGDGKSQFPADMFNDSVPAQAYIKYRIAEYLRSLTPSSISAVSDSNLGREIKALQKIRPHSIITTNYDQFLEIVFPEYKPIVGQQIIRGAISVGEIFKIHGCTSQPESLVLTQADYEEFIRKKKYLSAKLLTYFSEHPLLFVGYGAGDPNIKAILSDIDEALPIAGDMISNVFIAEWRRDIPKDASPAREKLIAIEESRSIRINAIETDSFAWVFEAFGSQHALPGISPKTLRALLVRSYELVRHDIPRTSIQANFEMLERAVENQEQFAKLFGLTTIANPSSMAASYPYTLTAVARKLGSVYWAKAQAAIDQIKKEKGFDLKASDNRYHYATKYGKSIVHKYSEDAVTLLRTVRNGEPYEIDS